MFICTTLPPDIRAHVEIPDALLHRMVVVLFDAAVISYEDTHTINPDSGIVFSGGEGAGIMDFNFAAKALAKSMESELLYYYQKTSSVNIINQSLLIILVNQLYHNPAFLKVLEFSYEQAVNVTKTDEIELDDLIEFDESDDYLAHEPESLAATQQILATLQSNLSK